MIMTIFRSSVCFVLISFFNICTASETLLDDTQPADGTPPATPTESQARFAAASHSDDEDDEPHDGTATETGQPRSANTTFAHKAGAENPHLAAVELEEQEFITVPTHANVLSEISISGGMFDTLVIPNSTMPYTAITLSNCTCYNPLDPEIFQKNLVLVRIILNGSQLNFRDFEEKFGEGCSNLSHINLLNASDVSVDGYSIITPERFAELAHPDVLQRILCGRCEVFISHPTRERAPYTLEEMKEKFLSSILQLRSLAKAKETLSTYQTVIEMLRTGVNKIDPTQLAAAGGRVLLGACTGL